MASRFQSHSAQSPCWPSGRFAANTFCSRNRRTAGLFCRQRGLAFLSPLPSSNGLVCACLLFAIPGHRNDKDFNSQPTRATRSMAARNHCPIVAYQPHTLGQRLTVCLHWFIGQPMFDFGGRIPCPAPVSGPNRILMADNAAGTILSICRGKVISAYCDSKLADVFSFYGSPACQ